MFQSGKRHFRHLCQVVLLCGFLVVSTWTHVCQPEIIYIILISLVALLGRVLATSQIIMWCILTQILHLISLMWPFSSGTNTTFQSCPYEFSHVFLCSNHTSGWTLVHTTSQKKGQHGHTIQDSWSALSMQRSPIFKSAISMDSGVSLILRQTHVLLNGTLSIVGQLRIYDLICTHELVQDFCHQPNSWSSQELPQHLLVSGMWT